MTAPDATLGGYLQKHSRPPSFDGSDGAAYSVEIYVTEDPDDDHASASFGGDGRYTLDRMLLKFRKPSD